MEAYHSTYLQNVVVVVSLNPRCSQLVVQVVGERHGTKHARRQRGAW